MRVGLTAVAAASMFLALCPAPSRAQDASAIAGRYVLSKEATYQSGCFAPCLCPVMQQAPVRGSFLLIPTGFDGLFETYTVREVSWTVSLPGTDMSITGSGRYKLGGEFALTQQLELDLSIAGNPVQHFDSGLVPAIAGAPPDATVSMNHMFCHDTVIAVATAPAPASIPALPRWAPLVLGALILAGAMRRRHRHAARGRH